MLSLSPSSRPSLHPSPATKSVLDNTEVLDLVPLPGFMLSNRRPSGESRVREVVGGCGGGGMGDFRGPGRQGRQEGVLVMLDFLRLSLNPVPTSGDDPGRSRGVRDDPGRSL